MMLTPPETWSCLISNLRSKTRQRASLLLLTWIYLCRSEVTVNFTLPPTTNEMISISSSQIFRALVTIFQPRPPMASSQLIRYVRACSSYGCFILSTTRLSNKLLEQGYHKERLKLSLRKYYGRYGDLIKQYEVPLSRMLNDILWPDHIQWQSPTDQTLYRTRPFTEFWKVSIEHLRRVWHADSGRYLLWTELIRNR